MLVNFIMFIAAAVGTAWSWHKDDIGAVALGGVVSFMSCPFAIEYVVNLFK